MCDGCGVCEVSADAGGEARVSDVAGVIVHGEVGAEGVGGGCARESWWLWLCGRSCPLLLLLWVQWLVQSVWWVCVQGKRRVGGLTGLGPAAWAGSKAACGALPLSHRACTVGLHGARCGGCGGWCFDAGGGGGEGGRGWKG